MITKVSLLKRIEAHAMLLDSLSRRISRLTETAGTLDLAVTRLTERLDKLDGDPTQRPWHSTWGLGANLIRPRGQVEELQGLLYQVEGDLNQLKAADGEFYRRRKQVLQRRVGKKRDKPVLNAESINAADVAVERLNAERS